MFAKLAYKRGLSVSKFIFIRHLVLTMGSFTFGKIRGYNLNIFSYDPEIVMLVFLRAGFGLISKTCQYAAISFIPLTLSSCISFTTGPIFAAILAFAVLGERLSVMESISVASGVIGTSMLTMPQWFEFLGLDD